MLEKIELRNVEMSLDIQTRFLQVRANIYYLIGSVDAMYSELKKIAKILPKIENIEVRETLQTFKDNLISLALAETESLASARQFASENLRKIGNVNREILSLLLSNLGYIARMNGDYRDAEENLLQSIKISKTSRNEYAQANDFRHLALNYLAQGKIEKSKKFFNSASILSRKHGLKYNLAWTILGRLEASINKKTLKNTIKF